MAGTVIAKDFKKASLPSQKAPAVERMTGVVVESFRDGAWTARKRLSVHHRRHLFRGISLHHFTTTSFGRLPALQGF